MHKVSCPTVDHHLSEILDYSIWRTSSLPDLRSNIFITFHQFDCLHQLMIHLFLVPSHFLVLNHVVYHVVIRIDLLSTVVLEHHTESTVFVLSRRYFCELLPLNLRPIYLGRFLWFFHSFYSVAHILQSMHF